MNEDIIADYTSESCAITENIIEVVTSALEAFEKENDGDRYTRAIEILSALERVKIDQIGINSANLSIFANAARTIDVWLQQILNDSYIPIHARAITQYERYMDTLCPPLSTPQGLRYLMTSQEGTAFRCTL